MDANTMRAQFLLAKEGANLSNRLFNDREISTFLSKAEMEFVQSRYAAYKNRANKGYGDSSLRNAELGGLVTGTRKISKQYLIGTGRYNRSAGANNPFMEGTISNGALRRPDLDNNLDSNGEEPSDHFGIFVALPNECMYVITEFVDTVKDTVQKFNVPVKEITYDYYTRGIYDRFYNPYDNLVWSLDSGAFTPSFISMDGTITDSTKDYTLLGTGFNLQGMSTPYYNNSTTTQAQVTINTARARQLIPGKGWDVVGYYINYIVSPKGIKVDVQTPANQVNSILPEFVHKDIIDIAVKLAAATLVPEQSQYQVAQIESKEDE